LAAAKRAEGSRRSPFLSECKYWFHVLFLCARRSTTAAGVREASANPAALNAALTGSVTIQGKNRMSHLHTVTVTQNTHNRLLNRTHHVCNTKSGTGNAHGPLVLVCFRYSSHSPPSNERNRPSHTTTVCLNSSLVYSRRIAQPHSTPHTSYLLVGRWPALIPVLDRYQHSGVAGGQ